MHPRLEARRTIFLKNNIPQVSLIHPAAQFGFLNLRPYFGV
jgi:hypothetical protein